MEWFGVIFVMIFAFWLTEVLVQGKKRSRWTQPARRPPYAAMLRAAAATAALSCLFPPPEELWVVVGVG